MRIQRACELLKHLNEFRRVQKFVYETSQAQSLTELLLAIHEEVAVDICDVVRLRTPALVLDIDLNLSGLNRDKLNAALKRQRSSFFSAGELM